MARKQAETATLPTDSVEVRALVDRQDLGFSAGRLAQVSAADLPGLKSANLVDDHPDAVAYAKSIEPTEAPADPS